MVTMVTDFLFLVTRKKYINESQNRTLCYLFYHLCFHLKMEIHDLSFLPSSFFHFCPHSALRGPLLNRG